MELQLQTLLRDKRALENKMFKVASGYSLEDTEAANRADFDASLGKHQYINILYTLSDHLKFINTNMVFQLSSSSFSVQDMIQVIKYL